jgi:hypothetical protein
LPLPLPLPNGQRRKLLLLLLRPRRELLNELLLKLACKLVQMLLPDKELL